MQSYHRQNIIPQLVRIYIYNEQEPSCLLFSTDIHEQQYGHIRDEEQLLVDFAGFADKAAWLLDQCTMSNAQNNKFRAVLYSNTGMLKLLESNSFKDLAHLSLRLKSGTDATIKQFLSFRLHEIKEECARLSASLNDALGHTASLQAELSTVVAANQSQQKKMEGQESSIATLQSQLERAQSVVRRLEEEQKEAKETAATLISTKEALDSMQQANLRLQNQVLELKNALKEAKTGREAAEAAAAQVAQRCQGFEAALRQAELRTEEWKGIANGYETKSNEVSAEVVKLRKQCLERETELGKTQQQLATQETLALQAQRETKEALDRVAAVGASAMATQQAASAALSSLEESKKKAEANEKMIAWLNKQLTAAQIQSVHISSIAVAREKQQPSPVAPPVAPQPQPLPLIEKQTTITTPSDAPLTPQKPSSRLPSSPPVSTPHTHTCTHINGACATAVASPPYPQPRTLPHLLVQNKLQSR